MSVSAGSTGGPRAAASGGGVAELSSEDHSLVRELQREVIVPNAASIADAFYARLRREPEFERILMANRARLENLKMTCRRYLLSFGVDFESADDSLASPSTPALRGSSR
jgi:hypothetical protein